MKKELKSRKKLYCHCERPKEARQSQSEIASPPARNDSKALALRSNWTSYAPCALFVCLMFFTMHHAAFAFQNEPEDFRGVKWAAQIKDLKDMIPHLPMSPLKQEAKEKQLAVSKDTTYTKKDELLQMGKAGIEGVDYKFYKDKFYMAVVYFKKEINFKQLKEMLEEQYGAPIKPNVNFEEFEWKGEKVNIYIIYRPSRERGDVTYVYKSIQEEKKRDAKQKEKMRKMKRGE